MIKIRLKHYDINLHYIFFIFLINKYFFVFSIEMNEKKFGGNWSKFGDKRVILGQQKIYAKLNYKDGYLLTLLLIFYKVLKEKVNQW